MVFEISQYWLGFICGVVAVIVLLVTLGKSGWPGAKDEDD